MARKTSAWATLHLENKKFLAVGIASEDHASPILCTESLHRTRKVVAVIIKRLKKISLTWATRAEIDIVIGSADAEIMRSHVDNIKSGGRD